MENCNEGMITKEANAVKNNRGRLISINQYHILERIGMGGFAEVRLAEVRSESTPPQRYAIKFLEKKIMRKRNGVFRRSFKAKLDQAIEGDQAMLEIAIMKKLQHPNLVGLVEAIDDDESGKMLLIMEYVQGGTIMEYNSSQRSFSFYLTGGAMGEATACRYFRDLLSVCEYLHTNHIAHRDLKPDNLLVTLDGVLKVTDFGVSAFFAAEAMRRPIGLKELMKSESRGIVFNAEGTWSFYSPEMCSSDRSGYSAYLADVWAASVCFWIFIFGRLPFESEDAYGIFEVIRECEPVPPHNVSSDILEIFSKLLNKDPTKRLCVEEALDHPLIKISNRRPSRQVELSSADFSMAVSVATTVVRSEEVTPAPISQLVAPHVRRMLILRARKASDEIHKKNRSRRAIIEHRISEMVQRAGKEEARLLARTHAREESDQNGLVQGEESFDFEDDGFSESSIGSPYSVDGFQKQPVHLPYLNPPQPLDNPLISNRPSLLSPVSSPPVLSWDTGQMQMCHELSREVPHTECLVQEQKELDAQTIESQGDVLKSSQAVGEVQTVARTTSSFTATRGRSIATAKCL